jgi:hypothetical protein
VPFSGFLVIFGSTVSFYSVKQLSGGTPQDRGLGLWHRPEFLKFYYLKKALQTETSKAEHTLF